MTVLVIALTAGLTTLVLSLLLPFVVRPVLIKLGIMDVPNERSSHDKPILRGLGLAVLAALVIGGALAMVLLTSAPVQDGGQRTLLIVLLGALASGLLGLREDLKGLSVTVRSLITLVIALGSSATLLWVAQSQQTSIGLGLQIAAVVYAVLFISSYINVANFMDGLNGISGFHGVIAGLTFAAAGWISALPWLVIAGLVLAAAFAGFLPWNLTKPGAFLGDVGSYLLGGATAIVSFAAVIDGVAFLAAVGPMVLYFGDVGTTLVKRVRAGKSWHEPHKEHTYQRIQQLGYSHLQASAMTAGLSVLTSVLGLATMFTHLAGTLALLAAGFAVLVFYLALPRLLPPVVTR